MSGSLPYGFSIVRRDAMVQWNEWWTAAHVEIGGNDSVSKTPCGEKLFLICGSYQTSRDFNNVMGTPQYFMDLIARGPSVSGLRKGVWIYIPAKDNVLSQPFVVCAGCFNSYKKLPLVNGGEARDQSKGIVDQTLGSFAYGVRKGVLKKIAMSNNKNKTQYETGRKWNINWWCWWCDWACAGFC